MVLDGYSQMHPPRFPQLGRSVENATFLLWQACSPRAGLRPEWATVGETLRKAVAAVLELHASTKKLGMLDVESNDIEIEAPSR